MIVTVEIPELRDSLRVSIPSGRELLLIRGLMSRIAKAPPQSTLRAVARLIVLVAVDEKGAPLFTVDDIPALEKKSFVNFLSPVCIAISRAVADACKAGKVKVK